MSESGSIPEGEKVSRLTPEVLHQGRHFLEINSVPRFPHWSHRIGQHKSHVGGYDGNGANKRHCDFNHRRPGVGRLASTNQQGVAHHVAVQQTDRFRRYVARRTG